MRKEDCKRLLCFLTVDTTDKDPEGNETVWFQNEVTRNKVDSGYLKDESYIVLQNSTTIT